MNFIFHLVLPTTHIVKIIYAILRVYTRKVEWLKIRFMTTGFQTHLYVGKFAYIKHMYPNFVYLLTAVKII